MILISNREAIHKTCFNFTLSTITLIRQIFEIAERKRAWQSNQILQSGNLGHRLRFLLPGRGRART